MEIDGENETEATENNNVNGESYVEGTIEPSSAVIQQARSNDSTADSESEKLKEEKQPELPGLVIKAQNEGTHLFKLGRYAEAAEQYTQAIDILQKGTSKYMNKTGSPNEKKNRKRLRNAVFCFNYFSCHFMVF